MTKRGRHTSVDKNLRRAVLWLESLETVRRVILGFTESCRHSFPAGHLRHRHDVPGGFKMNGYGGSTIVDIFVGLDDEDLENVKALIEAKFPN
jgi:hypothetical protein